MIFDYVDFHTHLDFYPHQQYSTTLECITQNRILTVASSVNIKSFKENKKLELKGANNLIIPTFGIHPGYLNELPENEQEAVEILSEAGLL